MNRPLTDNEFVEFVRLAESGEIVELAKEAVVSRAELSLLREFVAAVKAAKVEVEDRYYKMHGDDWIVRIFAPLDAALTRLDDGRKG